MSIAPQPLLDRPRVWTWGLGPANVVYALLLAATGNLHIDQTVVLIAWTAIIYLPKLQVARKPLLPFFVFGYVYDSLRFVIPFVHAHMPIHVADLYNAELALFGVTLADGSIVTLPEVFIHHTHVVADLVGAVAYFFFVFVPWGLAIYLVFADRPLCTRYGWAFLTVSLLGFLTYFLYPAAPPWYVEMYGTGPVDPSTPAHPARLAAVDELLGIQYFQAIYSRASNVFGAMPSMHAAYPLMAWLYARKALPRLHWAFFIYWLTVCGSAVYLRHHYVLDILVGALYAYLVFGMVETTARMRRSSGTSDTLSESD